ncbi:TM2 domain-containing protein [Corynebacterium glutamicum]|uniref:TM2 domain-containing protein n=2 Tax=Corynebacterium glutamicum TaxID=1718 RepID=Q5KRG1_CORGT|nr:TM2 domain-containing protein [Corynebacterium glutamicum]BAD84126.1 hypothetical protein [Corynebacterium glutamicum]BAF54918.1 hypothetical protein cgR_1923 [Corynebacterium glutamicum R]
MTYFDKEDGRFILNSVQRPTVPVEPTTEAASFIASHKGKRTFVDIKTSETGVLVVYSRTEPPIPIATLGETTDAVYGDVLRQVIDKGWTPTVEATIENIGEDYSTVSLHFRQDAEELVWGKFKRRPDAATQARLDESAEMQRRAKEALQESRLMQKRSNAMNDYQGSKKNPTVMWLLWLVLGSIGVHRFYLGDNKQGVLMLIAGLCFWIPGLIWAIIDAFAIGRRILQVNHQIWSTIATKHRIELDPLPEGTYK